MSIVEFKCGCPLGGMVDTTDLKSVSYSGVSVKSDSGYLNKYY